MTVLRCKVAIVGDAKVGKTALTNAFHKSKAFQKNYVMTLGVEFLVKGVKIPDSDDTVVELYLFDIAGNPIYSHVRSQYYEGASMMIVVYDVTNRQSYLSVPKWIEECKQVIKSNNKLQGILVGMKNDLSDLAAVKTEEANELAAEHNMAFFECSALSGKDVDTPFNFLSNAFYLQYEEKRKLMEEHID